MVRAQIFPAIVMTLLLTVFCAVLFPALMWGLAQVLFPGAANGSLITKEGKIVGSHLIGQAFSAPQYFQPRPSAAGSGYDPLASSGTNLGPTSKKLFEGIADDPETKDVDESYPGVEGLAKKYRQDNLLAADALVPVDAVTRSGSGLDPHISVHNAKLQSARVAKVRGLSRNRIDALVDRNTERRFLGIFGEDRVNVLLLNLALDAEQQD